MDGVDKPLWTFNVYPKQKGRNKKGKNNDKKIIREEKENERE